VPPSLSKLAFCSLFRFMGGFSLDEFVYDWLHFGTVYA